MEIKWYGTASLGIVDGDRSILIDPFFNRNSKLPCAQMSDFTQYDCILLTHGHYDHLVDVPKILAAGNAKVYCTKTPAKTLVKLGADKSRINVISPASSITINDFVIDVYHSKHVVFDFNTILKRAVCLDFYRHLPSSLKIISTSVTMPEAGEIVGYHVHTADDDAFILGSLSYDKNVSYPQNVKTLVVPYNGCSKLEKTALTVAELFKPSRVVLDHYDDSFPPITQNVETHGFLKLMNDLHPEIPVECMSCCCKSVAV